MRPTRWAPRARLAGLTGLASCFAFAAPACTSEQVSGSAHLTEPLQVESGQFGIAAPAADAGGAPSTGDAGDGVDPQVTEVSFPGIVVHPGTEGLTVSGHATPTTQTVALGFAGLGTGYWVVPVGAPDTTDLGLLSWQAVVDFARDLAPGPQALVFSAIDATGASGSQTVLHLCIDTPVPDNLNACAPGRAPPAAVLSLDWDAPVDLDVIVQTPSGALVGGNSFTTGGASPGVLDHHSNENCVIDNVDRDDIVWSSAPAAGTYQVWVDLVRACGQPAVNFNVTLWLAETRPDAGTLQLAAQPALAHGVLTASQANGGADNGLFVGSFEIR
jgi:hypothetical protein